MTYRIPISTVQGTTVYREVDPRQGGDDPLMRWISAAADWGICDLAWSERQDHPEVATWRGGELWDAQTDGEVTVRCKFPSGSAPHVQVTAPLRPAIRGSVDLGGFRWTVRPPTEAPPRVNHGASVGASGGLAGLNVAIGMRALASDGDDVDDGAVLDGPYRTAGEPATVTAGSLLHVTCFGVVDAAFKKTLEAGIRRVYKMFATRAKLNTVIV